MAITWPATLPDKPQQRGWEDKPGDNSLTTQMEVGPVKKRQRNTLFLDEFKVTYILTAAQMATLKTFFETTTSSGVTEFEWDHPITAATLTVIFTSAPVYIPHGIDYLTTFTLKEN